jgi:hypothetical protein
MRFRPARLLRSAADEVVSHSMDINHASLDDQLRFAIANKRLLQITYGQGTRIAEPHDYGLQKGTVKLLTYQLRRTGGAPGKSATGWRLLDVAKIDGCAVLEQTFAGSRGVSHQHHYVWDVLYARVT